MEWLFRPKVQLGLFVNFVFVMFTLVSSLAGAATCDMGVFADERRGYAAELSAPTPTPADNSKFRYVQLPPRVGPPQAASYRNQQTGELSVYTTKELTLVKKDGRTLKLWPLFYSSGPSIVPPRKVLLRFTSTAPSRVYANECDLEVKADGANFWAVSSVSLDRAPKGGGQGVVESMGQDITYPVFLKLITSKRPTLKVGDEEIVLTDEQLSALRDMQRCIQDAMCG